MQWMWETRLILLISRRRKQVRRQHILPESTLLPLPSLATTLLTIPKTYGVDRHLAYMMSIVPVSKHSPLPLKDFSLFCYQSTHHHPMPSVQGHHHHSQWCYRQQLSLGTHDFSSDSQRRHRMGDPSIWVPLTEAMLTLTVCCILLVPMSTHLGI